MQTYDKELIENIATYQVMSDGKSRHFPHWVKGVPEGNTRNGCSCVTYAKLVSIVVLARFLRLNVGTLKTFEISSRDGNKTQHINFSDVS